MTSYLLVPGFWIDASAWSAVADDLRSRGHDVTALDLGHDPAATARTRVDEILAALGDAGEPVVLVGHSGAGPVCAAVAEQARDRLAHLVFVDTGPPPDGVAQIDFSAPDAQAVTRATLAAHGALPMPSRAELDAAGSSTAGIPDAVFDDVRARSVAEPAGVVLTGAPRGTVDPSLPKTVVACSFTPADVRELIEAGVPGFAEMDGPEWRFVALPTGHWPMLSEPAGLAEVLDGLG
ncbi:alpha/beta fold hydrolase [Pseudonocardia sp. ICBG1293]|uniref:alpha/beta fold hydrolase n=1 Tax=Pseudonocardia sp. ICBG1293 TaxID=2844382 RepID=UPI001CCBE47B|nr:alpha/beta hydrolase [Pseudonocardia sp. ICBG1293]